jgi:hypothetical protein
MKTIAITALLAALLSACGGPPAIVQDKEMGYMSRPEVSAAINECEGAGQRATVIYARANWRDKTIPVPVDVQCLPRGQVAPRS